MLELNKRHTWSEIVKYYPSKYVIITDVKRKNGEIIDCKLLDVFSKEEKHIYRKKYTGSCIFFEIQRTTDEKDPMLGFLSI